MNGRQRVDVGPTWPRPLQPGDRVALVAPSGPVDADRLAAGRAVLESWGLDVVVGAQACARRGYLAGDDQSRARDLRTAWLDPDVAAVLCARGGYGATRLLEHIDPATLAATTSRAFVGASDTTALHALLSRAGRVSFFGPMPATAAFTDGGNAELLRRALFGAPIQVNGTATLVPGRAEGRLVGGTLTLLAALAGTPYAVPAHGGVVLLEDVNEVTYRLDRMLTQLLQAGWFDGVRGVALGSWSGCGEDALDVVCERLAPLGVPMLAGLPVGHSPQQHTVPLGARVVLDAGAATLTAQRS